MTEQVQGTYLSVSSAEAGAETEAAYSGLTFKTIGACTIQSVGVIGKTWATAEDKTLCSNATAPIKTKQSFDPFEAVIEYTPSDEDSKAAAIILKANRDSKSSNMSVRLTVGGDTDRAIYFKAQVMKFDFDGSGEEFTYPLTLQPQADPIAAATSDIAV